MADVPLPGMIRRWITDRRWGGHHLEWHNVRHWDTSDPATQAEMAAQGWSRAALQEGERGNGGEFLFMHRAMLQMLRAQFPADAALFDGWATPPTDPADAADPVPASLPPAARPFATAMRAAILRIEGGAAPFADEDELGLFIETARRPAPADPSHRSSDPGTGIHNYLHNRFADNLSAVDMGEPAVNLENARFWKLHGWIDAAWSKLRAAKGLSDTDPAYLAELEQAKDHLPGLHGQHHRHGIAAGPAARTALDRAAIGRLSTTLRRPFADTPAKKFRQVAKPNPAIASVDELKAYLQVAVSLELATLPPYLCAMWSLRSAGEHARIVKRIVFQEMLHLGIACNLLKALGGSPVLTTPETVVQFPDHLPGVEEFEHPVSLRPLSPDQVKVFMRIEKPAHPIPPTVAKSLVPRYPTIGEFYEAIRVAFRSLATLPALIQTGQLEAFIPGDELKIIADRDEACDAIQRIQEQGEGTPATQAATHVGGGLAHFYQFQQMDLGMKYKATPEPDGTYKLDPGAPLPFPSAAQICDMAPVPPGGYPMYTPALKFDELYSGMLADLQKAWAGEGQAALRRALAAMNSMRSDAQTLMDTPIPGGVGNYGPAFRLVPLPPVVVDGGSSGGGSAAVAVGYARVQQILDEAVHGDDIGAHGAFWRTLDRDHFVAKAVFGLKLIVARPDGAFDPEASNLVKALEGRAPFNADVEPLPADAEYPRMPVGYDPVDGAKILEIRAWIAAGCPDVPPP